MRIMLIAALAVALCGAVARAQMVLYEDFESYPVDETIHEKGTDQTDLKPGVDVPRWYAQQNSSVLADSDLAYVRSYGGNKVGQFRADVEEDYNAEDTTSGLAMSMESMQITGLGTIYMRYALRYCQELWMADSPSRGYFLDAVDESHAANHFGQ